MKKKLMDQARQIQIDTFQYHVPCLVPREMAELMTMVLRLAGHKEVEMVSGDVWVMDDHIQSPYLEKNQTYDQRVIRNFFWVEVGTIRVDYALRDLLGMNDEAIPYGVFTQATFPLYRHFRKVENGYRIKTTEASVKSILDKSKERYAEVSRKEISG